MNFERVMRLISEWAGTLTFFPGEPEARLGIAKEIASMAENEDQVRWLVGRVNKIYPKWPGILEIRAVFCTKFRPRDGQEAILGLKSPAYDVLDPEAVEARESALRLDSAPAMRQLNGQVEPQIRETVQDFLAQAMRESEARRKVPPLDPGEIEWVKAEQEKRRNPNAAAELARKLGLAE